MSYEDGWAAICLDKPKRVPRTEYSAENHWKLVQSVTGQDVDENSPLDVQKRSSELFCSPECWNYDFFWSILINRSELDAKRTRMGHATYASGGVDYDTRVECPFADVDEVLAFDPFEWYGTPDIESNTKRFNEHYYSIRQSKPDGVAMTGTYITLISGLLEIFGWDLLLEALGEDAKAFGEVANRYAKWIGYYMEALAKSDAPVVMIHDDIVWTSGPFVHPDWYRKYVFANYKWMFAPLVDSGKKIAYTSDGTYTVFVDDIAATGVHGFVMEPTTDMKYIADKYGKTHFFVGNADTRILLSNDKNAIRSEVEQCMAIGKKHPGFFMAVGNHIPPNTPVEAALYYNEVYEKLSRR